MSRWESGQSGNANGRPKGSGEVAQLRAMLKPYLPELLQRLMAQALAGDVTAARVILDRVMPTLKPENLPVYLPDFNPTSPLMQQGMQITRAIAAGEIASDVGSQLLAGVATLAGLKSVDELEQRIRALEGGDAFSEFA
jgi:hypothetical protein